MHSLRISAAAVWLAMNLVGSVSGNTIAGGESRINQYIVEYASGSSGVQARDSLASKGDIQVRKSFNSDFFNGASIETADFTLESLSALSEVANVWRNNVYKVKPLNGTTTQTKPLDYIVHNTTGVSKLHDAGVFGEGALVGVVDTGIDYTHKALGGCIGSGCKITGGWDFLGDEAWDPSMPKKPDSDPQDYIGHGTHVSGIVAGENDYWSGVAPKANIRMYKVFSDGTTEITDDETVIDAFLMAADDGVDIITCSVVEFGGWSQNVWAIVADRLVAEGIFVSISAGNEGAAGPFFASTGSSGKDVLAVASIASQKMPTKSWEVIYSPKTGDNTTTRAAYIPSSSIFPEAVNGWEIRPLTLDTTVADDACEAYANGTQSLEGVIPLVRRGTCDLVTKVKNLAAIGAKYVLIYTYENDMATPTSVDGVLAAMITADIGAKIVNTVKAGGKVTGDFSTDSEIPGYVDWASGGLASDFTSWGALNDLAVKPDVAAPGGLIWSTYLNQQYLVASGTSMSCPYVAGVAALWVGKNGGRKAHGKDWARTLGRRIISSGQLVPWYHSTGGVNTNFTAPVEQVGTGMVDAWKVLNYDTQLDFQTIGLNDTTHFSGSHDITLTNNGKKSITYAFSNAPGAGIETWTCPDNDCRVKSWSELEAIKLEVDVSLPDTITLQPGESKKVSVNFENPENKGWDAAAMPAYSGNIRIKGSSGEEMSVPYFGLAADLKGVVSSVYRSGYPTAVSTPENVTIEEDSSFTFNASDAALDFPRIVARFRWGSAQVRWDIFESDWTEEKWSWPLTAGENGYIGPVHGIDKSTGSSDYASVNATFPVRWVPRNAEASANQATHEYWWPEGLLGNGTKLESGNYTMRFAVLNPFGEPAKSDDWSVFKTPIITVM